MGCFTTIFIIFLAVFVLVSMIRWFEQASEAVQLGWWNKVFVLLAFPFIVWFFPSRVAAGRPIPVPHHEPVRGFGTMPKTPPLVPNAPTDKPRPRKRGGADPEQVAKLKEKMRQQGMLPPES